MRLKVLFCTALVLWTASLAPYFNDRAEAVIYRANTSGSSFLEGWYKPVGSSSGIKPKVTIQIPPATTAKNPIPVTTSPNQASPQPTKTVDRPQILAADEKALLGMINNARTAAGLKALAVDPAVQNLARLKALEMIQKGYFNHTSPTYGTLAAMLQKNGVKYALAAENLAGAPSAKVAYEALMGSPQHKANILSPQFTDIGIGAAGPSSRYGKIFVEILIKRSADQSSQPQEQAPASGNQPGQPQEQAPASGNQPGQPQEQAPASGNQPGQPQEQAPASGNQPGQPQEQAPATPVQPAPVQGLTADEQKMLDMVNQERAKAGLQPLAIDLDLVKVARLKARDMMDNNYFDHNSPTYGSPFDMMKQFGIKYSWAGENLAGAPTVDLAHTNLMNSAGHRANILRPQFTHVGIGVVDGGPYGKMFVQMFISKP